MRFAIVDDEKEQIDALFSLLSKELTNYDLGKVTIHCFQSENSFFETFEPEKYDCIFLDIYIDQDNGVDVARRIREIDTECTIVFCTTSNEFASESYEVNAQYYLQKPLNEEVVSSMLKRLNLYQMSTRQVVEFPDGFRCRLFDIYYTDYYNHKITIHLQGGNEHAIYMTQKDLEEMLLKFDVFFAITKGIIVSFDKTKKIDKQSLILIDETDLPIARNRLKDVKNALFAYKLKKLDD